MFKAIFWDNDGTLVDTEGLFFKATSEVLQKNGAILSMRFYIDECLKNNRSSFDLIREKGASEEDVNILRRERNEIYSGLLKDNVPVIEGVKGTLEKLQGKYFMAVVTSSRADHFDIIMESSGLKKYFDFFITSDDVRIEKPDPEPYLLALEKSGFAANDCIVIEDTERGLKSAKAAGLSCYVIPNHLSRENDFSKADKVLCSISDLLEIL